MKWILNDKEKFRKMTYEMPGLITDGHGLASARTCVIGDRSAVEITPHRAQVLLNGSNCFLTRFIDLRTQGEHYTGALDHVSRLTVVRAPAGMITREMFLHMTYPHVVREDAAYLVDGEEDLLVVPAILVGDFTTVVWGDPFIKNMVGVKVTDEARLHVLKMLRECGEWTE